MNNANSPFSANRAGGLGPARGRRIPRLDYSKPSAGYFFMLPPRHCDVSMLILSLHHRTVMIIRLQARSFLVNIGDCEIGNVCVPQLEAMF